jgi:hypothetical protein
MPQRTYRHTPAYFIVHGRLIDAARYRGVVTYQELVDLIGLPSSGNYMQHELGLLLGEINEDEVAHGRSMLAAVVVKVTGAVGSGFWRKAKKLGLLNAAGRRTRPPSWRRRALARVWAIPPWRPQP